MKIVYTVIATIAIITATVTTAQARKLNININIGGHGYTKHFISTHRHAPVFRSYYDAPVVYYAPAIRYNHFRPYVSYKRHIVRSYHKRGVNRYSKRGVNKYSKRHYRGHRHRGHRNSRR